MKKETFEPRKQKCTYEPYLTENGTAYKILDPDFRHIKSTTLQYVVDCVGDNGFIWIENNRKTLTLKEKTLIRLEHFRSEIKKLYKDYPDIIKSIEDSPVKTRNMYRSPVKIDEDGTEHNQKYGISFENGTSIYVPERIFALLDSPIRYLNL